jgi:flagellar basal body-associated protein FliL
VPAAVDLANVPPNIPPYLVAILVAAVLGLAGTVAYLFKHYSGKLSDVEDLRRRQADAIAQERQAWALERQKFDDQRDDFELKIRVEYETKHRALLETQVKLIAELHEVGRLHENEVRREFAELMATVADKAQESSDKIANVMDKFYNRYVGSRSRVKG